MRRSWIYSGLGSFLVTLTLLLTIFFPIVTKQHPVSAADETDYVDGFTEDVTVWIETGSSPYLDSAEGSNVISTFAGGADEYWFTFGDTSETGSGYTVTLYAYINGGDGADDVNIYIDTTGDNTPEFTDIINNPTGVGYSWYDTGVIAGLDTASEYNAARVWFERSATGTTMYIDAAYIRLQRTDAWVNRAPTISNWGPANESKNIVLYNRTSALVSDKDGNESLICMWYAPPSATFASPSSWTKAQQNGTSDPPTVNGTVRDMNSSWITTYGYYYWWKVTAKDETVNSTNGTKWFRTRFHNVTNSPSANETPANAATGQDFNPRLTVYTNETITRGYNATFRTNATGTWVDIGTNTSVTNGTHRWTPTTMSAYNHKYWWSVNSTGFASKTWDNDTYYFTTKNTVPTAASPSPSNDSASAATPKTAITVNTGGDAHSLTVTFFNNSSAAPTTWTNYGHNNSVGNGTYRHTASFASTPGIAYYWKVTVNDGVVNITYWYKFTVGSLIVSDPFPVNNSEHVLTGIGNLSVFINSTGTWNISLRDNTTYGLQAYATGASSSDAVQYCDVSDALYFQFDKDYTWYVNATDGAGTWENHTYYFTTFNGSGFHYVDHYDPDSVYFKNPYWDGEYLYVASGDDGLYAFSWNENRTEELWMKDIDTTTINATYSGPDTRDVAGDGTYLYTAGSFSEGVKAYTFNESGTEEFSYKTYTLNGTSCNHINSNETLIFVATSKNITVLSFDGSSFTVLDSYGINIVYQYVYWDDVNKYLYATESSNKKIQVFSWDGSNLVLIDEETCALAPKGIYDDGHYLYVAGYSAGVLVYSFDGATLTLEYTYTGIVKSVDVTKLGDNIFVTNDEDGIDSFLFEGGSFIFEDSIDNMTALGAYAEGVTSDNTIYLFMAGATDGVFVYGYALLHVAPPVIDLTYAGNPGKDTVTRDGTIRYVNQSYNNETFCNVTANISVPDYRTIGRYFRTTDDDIFIPSGNLTDNDNKYVNERNQSLIASKYTCSFSGYYSQISAYLIGSGMSQPWTAFAIYSDTAGDPGTLLGYTDRDYPGSDVFDETERDLGALYYPPSTRIWQTQDIAYDGNDDAATSVYLTQGTDYWLVFATNDSYGYKTYGYTYSNDIYWLLGNDLGDTCYVKMAPFNLEDDMNFSNATGLTWSDAEGMNGEEVHYACIYAIANSTYNDNIQTVDISSAVLHWYNDSVNTWNMSMTEIGSTGNWTKNVTGLTPGHWYTFDIVAFDELNDTVTYEHYRYIVEGNTERIEFQCGISYVDEAAHQGYNNTDSTFYRNESVLYLWNRTYGTDTWYGDDEQMEDALPHEQGVDGTADDTGGWETTLPDDDFQARHCLKFAGAWWDDNITIQDTVTLNNVYVHLWGGGGTKYDKMRLHYGQLDTLYNFQWLDLTSTRGVEYNYTELETNASTRESAVVTAAPETCSDPSGVDDTFRLICEYINLSEQIDDVTFDSGSIYNFFLGYDNNGTLAWTKESAMIINNRSYLSYILFNIPPDVLSGVDTRDSDDDGLSDHYELNTSFTHPFLKDTDGDGYDDNLDAEPNNYLEWERFWAVLDSSINGSIWNQTISWKVITSAMNGSIYNQTNWIVLDSAVNGSLYNLTDWIIISSSLNGSVYNQTASWTILSAVMNGSFYNVTNWIVLDSTVNGSLYNLSAWNIISDTINGTIWNQTISWKVVDSTINGTVYNNTGMWTVISSSINGSIWNQSSQWRVLSTIVNGSVYNVSEWTIISSTINGSIWNQTISWKVIDVTLNGTLYNSSGAWTVVSSTMNGSVYNTSVWSVISSIINGSISNTSWVWQAFSTTLNGSIYNNTGAWTVISSTLNGSIYNRSATWNIISSTLNGSIYNLSTWDAFSTSFNGSIYNNTGVWHDFNLKLNGSIYNTSRWSIISSSLNGSIYNRSVWTVLSDTLNGSIYNTSSWDAFDTTLNGSIWNTTSSWGVFSSTLNGSIYNMSGTWSIINVDINGSISNMTLWRTVNTTINGSLYNISSWHITNNTVNGTIFNTTHWTGIDTTMNGSVYNLSSWKAWNTTVNGSMYNISSWHITNNTINGTIYNMSTYGWSPISTLINGSIWNQTPSWTLLTSDINGSIYNITTWTTIDDAINGTIYNQTATWIIIDATLNGTIYNLSEWILVDTSMNGSVYNASEWTVFNNTNNGSLYNVSQWHILNNTLNGTIYNLSTYDWTPISTDINGTIYNTSVWNILDVTMNGTIFNISSYSIIDNSINGTIYNISTWDIFNNTINGSFYNQTRWTTINNTVNGSVFNVTAWVVIDSSLNGSIYNITTYIIIDSAINGTLYNISAWMTINNTINGTIFNLSVAITILDIYPANESTGIPRNVTYHITVAHTQGALMNITWYRDNGSVYLGSSLTIPNGTYFMFSNASLANHKYWWWINVSAGGVWNNSSQWYQTGMQMAGSTSVIGGGNNRLTTYFILGLAFGIVGSIFMVGRRRKKKRQRR